VVIRAVIFGYNYRAQSKDIHVAGYQKLAKKAGIIGLLLSFASSLIPYQFCGCGIGLGVPLAIIYPHRGSRWIVEVYSRGETSWFLDFKNISTNVVIWVSLTLAVLVLRRVVANRFISAE